ncbi:hypothetical protein [Rhodovarius sp.]|uniref:hypothetical protein n=1 Tax=Rhodovarius sp. TaxID=2972673 RepID=UPI0034A472DC
MTPSECGLVVLRSHGPRLAKTLHPGGTVTICGGARTFDMAEVTVASLGDLYGILTKLAIRPDLCAVRAAIADRDHTHGVRRLFRPDPGTGDVATLREVPRRWVALDIDGIQAPAGLIASDLAACLGVVLPLLPAGFQGAALIVQATAGHGVKPGLRLRVWAWLSRPAMGAELARWLAALPCLDRASFRPSQIIYTAAPILANGATDPLPDGRLYFATGRATVEVPAPHNLVMPPSRVMPAPRITGSTLPNARYGAAALVRAAANIMAQPEGGRHETAVAEAWGLARLAKAGAVTASDVTRVIEGALRHAGKPDGEGEAIAAWALAQRGAA